MERDSKPSIEHPDPRIPPAPGSRPSVPRAWVPVLAGVVAFLVTLGTRLWFVGRYCVDMPFLDQWSAELEQLLLPYARGELEWTALFALHNEHRLLFTRLLSLAVFEVHGSWSPRLVGQVQTVLPAATAGLLAYWSGRDFRARATALALIVACFALPLAVTNAVWSFQSQFGFLILFSVVAMRLASCGEVSIARFLGAGLFSVFAFLGMGGGALTALVCAGVLLLRASLGGWDRRLLGMSLVLAALGTALFALVPGSGGLGAGSLSQLFGAVQQMLLWPRGAGALVWVPAIALLVGVARREPQQPRSYLFVVALLVWSLAMTVAVAARRGEMVLLIYEHHKIFDRYTDLLLPSFVAVAFLVGAWEAGPGRALADRLLHPRLVELGLVVALAWFAWANSFDHAAVLRDALTRNQAMAREALRVPGPSAAWHLGFHDDPRHLLELLRAAEAEGILPALSPDAAP